MGWKRFGVFYLPDGSRSWARSHATLPTVVARGGDTFRIYFSARDSGQRSHIGWVDVDHSKDARLVAEATVPALAPGDDGAFDDSGVSVACVVEQRLYYLGWNLGVRVPWRNAIGLAEANESASQYRRLSPGPILDRSPEDPFTLSYPWVMRLQGNDWRMWYGSTLAPNWTRIEMRHALKSARSRDGINWERDGRVVVDFADTNETAIARPTVTKIGSRYCMWFACRGERYRIGCSVSPDGKTWTRCDEFGLLPSANGWDSEMVCYPCVFWHHEQLWLAYNGNGFGATGFGLAVWEGNLPI